MKQSKIITMTLSVDSRLTVTDDPEDKIGKNSTRRLSTATCPKKHLTVQQITEQSQKKEKVCRTVTYGTKHIL